MDRDRQRLLDVIDDPNALENFLGLSSFAAEQQANRAYTQSPAIASPASVIQAASPFSAPYASASPNPAILRSPAPARSPAPIQQFQTVTSPASNVQAGLRHAPSPLQQPMRPGSVPNTPVPSPVSYPPGPGPGTPVSIANFNPSMLQALHNSGAITINSSMLQGMPQLVGGQMQQLMGGSMVQIMSAQAMATPSPSQPQPISHPNTNIRPTPTTSGRSKQPQLLPKPSAQQQSNSNSNSPKTSNIARAAASKVPSPAPQPVQNVPQMHHQHQVQQQQQQQQQAQPQQQFFQAHHNQSPQQNGNSIVFNQGTVLSSQQGGAMVLNSVIPGLGHGGGQQFLIQQPGGGFQILVRPPQQATTHAQAAVNANQQRGHTILVPHPLGGLTNAQILRSHAQQQQQQHQLQQQHQQLTAQAQQQAMLRLLSPNMGAVQLQQIQTPNGPAYIAVQQHTNPTMIQSNLQTVTNLQNMRTLTAPHNASVSSAHLYSSNSNLAPMNDDRTHLVSSAQAYNTVERVQSMPQVSAQVQGQPVPTAQQQQQQAQPEPAQTPAPPPKKPPPKKRPKKKKKEEEKKEVKKLNLEELLKESGITEEEGFDFGLDSVDEAPPPPPSNPPHPPPPQRLPEPAPSADGSMMTSSTPLQLTIGEDGQLVIQGGQGLSAQEANQALLQALQQHGLSLATPSEALEGSIVREPAQAAQPQPQPVQTRPNPPPAAKEQPNIGFQNTFLESLARSQNIPTPKKPKKSYPKKKKKKEEPVAQAPPPNVSAVSEGETGIHQGNNTQKNGINGMPTYVIAQGDGATHTSSSNNPQTNSTMMSVVNINSGQMMPSNMVSPNVMTQAGGNVVHRVQTIQLTPQNQQSLRNIQAQIQYLTSKKDPSPQESTLLQKLIQHQQKILMTGKPIPTIPGQHAQGVQFNPPVNANHSQSDSSAIPQHVTTKGGHSKPVPANIQQNTHLANLLRGDKPATPTRMATANVNQAAQPVRYFHQIGNQVISLTPQQSRPTTMVAAPAQQPTLATPTPMLAGPQPVRQMVIMPHALTPPTPGPAVVTSVAAKVIVSSSTTVKVMGVPAVSLANSTASTSAGPVTAVSKAPQMPVAATVNANTIAVAIKSEPSPVATPVITRGLKRGAITPPKPSISKSTLFEHQLKTDQNGALTPDCKSPFKNKSNACKRLIRYHVFHEKEPHPREEEKAEEWFEATAEHFALKFRQMLNKYHYLLLMDSMKEAPASEYVMIDRLFVADEKGLLERLKEEAAQPKEEGTVMIPEEVVAKKEVEPRFPKLKLSRKDGEHYKSELKEVRVVMEDVVRNGHFKKEGYECDTASQESSSASQSTTHHYNEWEAIRNEVAFFTQDGEGAGPGTGGPFHLHDDLLHSQVQSAIDGILNLQKLDEGEDHDPSTVTAMDLGTSDGRVGPEAMDYEPSLSQYDGSLMDDCSDSTELQGDVALNEAVRSILT